LFANNICMGCMEEKGDVQVCPKCGWIEGTQSESPLHLKAGTILSNKYLVGRVLGHGGFGITYLACDINLGSKLAIKEYFPQGMATRNMGDATISVYSGGTKEQFEYGLDKFLEEARTLAKFDDISEIVTAKDFFKENGTAYLVMSYVEGITLKQYLEQNGGKLPLDVVLNIILPIMKALEQVHKAGILHRDISPDNIYITNNFNVKLLDFGAARFAIGEHSKSLSVILKPGYAPEEQYRSRGKQGPWTDVYATGATIYKALTGETPPESMDRLDEDNIIKPSALGVEINKKFEDVLMKSMAVRAIGRFQSIDEFETELFMEIPRDTYTKIDIPSSDNSKQEERNTNKNEARTDSKSQFNFVGDFQQGPEDVKKDGTKGVEVRKSTNLTIAISILTILMLIFVLIEAYKIGINNRKENTQQAINSTTTSVSEENSSANLKPQVSDDSSSQSSTTPTTKENQNNVPVDNLDQKEFLMTGTINGTLKIHMNLHFSKKEVTGTYYYDKYKTNIKIIGNYDSEYNVNMKEFDDKGNNTGVFNGKISSTGEFDGNWSTSNGTKKMPFTLNSNN